MRSLILMMTCKTELCLLGVLAQEKTAQLLEFKEPLIGDDEPTPYYPMPYLGPSQRMSDRDGDGLGGESDWGSDGASYGDEEDIGVDSSGSEGFESHVERKRDESEVSFAEMDHETSMEVLSEETDDVSAYTSDDEEIDQLDEDQY